ncbi:MAG: M20/M25/M40 family metallo-hydrolase, partial [Actinobacteria bacterium]|nr:M20/M25/M40 family metallo-hydrolase [Actinomycetota bacterium]
SMELGRVAPNVSANVGTISGGNADNIIPAECRVTGECRALTREILDRTRSSLEEAMQDAARAGGGKVTTDWKLEYEGFRFDEEDEMVKLVCSAATAIGLEARVEISGGGTDANILSSKGARPLALGTGMTDFHATTEHIAVRDLVDTARHILAICSAIASR